MAELVGLIGPYVVGAVALIGGVLGLFWGGKRAGRAAAEKERAAADAKAARDMHRRMSDAESDRPDGAGAARERLRDRARRARG